MFSVLGLSVCGCGVLVISIFVDDDNVVVGVSEVECCGYRKLVCF